MKNIHPSYLHKSEDLKMYRKMAAEGSDLMHTVSVKGKTHRPDINIPYHTTIKLFNPQKDSPEQIHEVASKLNMNPPDPKNVGIEPTTLKGRNGNTMHVLKLHGPHAEEIKEHHKKFAHMGHPEKYEFHPHITVDEALYNHALHSGAKTAADLGITFGNAELHHKDKIVANYKPKVAGQPGQDAPTHDKLNKSEILQKGALKNLGVAAAMGSALLSSHAHAPTQDHPKYSSDKMLNAISSVESNKGKDTEHKEGGGAIHGKEHAYGKYATMPETIRETIRMHSDLKAKHGKAMNLKGDDIHHYMKDNPGLEDTIAQRHLKRLEHHFGPRPDRIGHAWFNGISGTNKALKDHKDIGNHFHVKKIREAYSKEK